MRSLTSRFLAFWPNTFERRKVGLCADHFQHCKWNVICFETIDFERVTFLRAQWIEIKFARRGALQKILNLFVDKCRRRPPPWGRRRARARAKSKPKKNSHCQLGGPLTNDYHFCIKNEHFHRVNLKFLNPSCPAALKKADPIVHKFNHDFQRNLWIWR